MSENNIKQYLTAALLVALEETFENVHGLYLDKGTSLFETLTTISAEEASQAVSENCASLAAQVAHIHYFLDILLQQVKGEQPDVNWGEVWETVHEVSADEWQESQEKLRKTYKNIRHLAENTPWDNEAQVRGALAMLMHNAYHLGEIRQALCTIKNNK